MHLTILLLSYFFFWASPVDWQTLQSNVAIRGSVLDESSGRAVPGAVVYAISAADVSRTTANSKGHFYFLTLLPGEYRLCAATNGYAVNCDPGNPESEELFAGFEYGATVVLSR